MAIFGPSKMTLMCFKKANFPVTYSPNREVLFPKRKIWFRHKIVISQVEYVNCVFLDLHIRIYRNTPSLRSFYALPTAYFQVLLATSLFYTQFYKFWLVDQVFWPKIRRARWNWSQVIDFSQTNDILVKTLENSNGRFLCPKSAILV